VDFFFLFYTLLLRYFCKYETVLVISGLMEGNISKRVLFKEDSYWHFIAFCSCFCCP